MLKTKHIMAKIFLFAKVVKLPVMVSATFSVLLQKYEKQNTDIHNKEIIKEPSCSLWGS